MPRPSPLLVMLLLSAAAGGECAVSAEDPVSFRREIAPLLLERCVACHNDKKAEGGLRVDSFAHLMGEGDSGPAVTAGDAGKSELFVRIESEIAEERMPAEGAPLTSAEIGLFELWIAAGAKFDAEDSAAPLWSIVPRPEYPPAPEGYPRAIPITALAFLGEEELAVAGYHEITVWNARSGALVRRLGGMPPKVLSLRALEEGRKLLVGGGIAGRRGEVFLVDSRQGTIETALPPAADLVWDVAPSPDGRFLAAAGADSNIRIFNLAERRLEQTLTNHSDWVQAVAWSQDGKRLATASRDGSAKVISRESGEVLASYSGHERPVTGIRFLPGDNELLSCGLDGKVHRWNAKEGKRIGNPGSVGGEAYRLLPAGEFCFVGGSEKKVMQWKPGDVQAPVRTFPGAAESILSLARSPGGKLLAAGDFSGEVLVWNAENGELLIRFRAAPGVETTPE